MYCIHQYKSHKQSKLYRSKAEACAKHISRLSLQRVYYFDIIKYKFFQD